MDRQVYNECMKPYISGKGMSKEERRMRFCVGAKVCSGKVATEEEAAHVCSVPKVPKWARGREAEGNQLPVSCTERTTRAKQALDKLKSAVHEGNPDMALDDAAQTINDIYACHTDVGTLAMVDDAFSDFKGLTNRAYLKGEGIELKRKLELVEALL